MHTLAVKKDIVFQYTDSGPADHNEYSTLIFVHGLSFNSGIFQKLLPIANSHKLRVICPNRRGYQGTSTYTDEETRIINHGSDDERANFIHEQGVLMALFVDGIIQTLSLPKAGGVTVIGWSMGNHFTLGLRACIGDLPVDIQQRLKSYARSFILLDAPIPSLGFTSPNPPPPSQLSHDEFVAFFPKYFSAYYKHVNLDSKDPSQLNQIGDPSRKPTTETMTPEELSSTLDFTPFSKFEKPLLLHFSLALSNQMTKALVDPQVRKDWGGTPVWYLVGDSNIEPIQTASWVLEEKIGSQVFNQLINFKLIKDANHFLMWEEPDRFLALMKECIPA